MRLNNSKCWDGGHLSYGNVRLRTSVGSSSRLRRFLGPPQTK